MRKILAIVALILGCLFVAQSTMAAAAAYGECCAEGCQGMAQCVNLGCQVCSLPLAAPPPQGQPAVFTAVAERACAEGLQPPAPFAEIWTPPD